jgi:CRP/FNR family transcriptional regulator, nitrogen oxide reductase regulator
MDCGCKLVGIDRIAGLPAGLNPRLFAGLTRSDLHSLLSAAKHRRFRARSLALHQEDQADHFFVLTSGQGRQFVLTPKGKRVLLFWLTPGQVFGGASVLSTPFHYLASTQLMTESCALMWDRRTIRTFASRCPQFLDNCLSIAASEHVTWLIAAQVSLSSNDARGRIAHLLAALACGVGRITPDGIELTISNEDLSAGANVTLFTVSRILNDWQRAGVVVKGRGKILMQSPLLLTSAA